MQGLHNFPFPAMAGKGKINSSLKVCCLKEGSSSFNITRRWGILGFTGIGTAFDSLENMESDEIVWNVGGGFRYLIARALGVKMGADIARGPEDWAFYVTMGTSWPK